MQEMLKKCLSAENKGVPAQAVCERGRPGQVALSIDCAAIPSRAEGPERRGWAWQVQADVPERIYRRGNSTTHKKKMRVWIACLA